MPIADYSKQFNTELDPGMEQQFLEWAHANNKLNDVYDYDLRGAFKDGLTQSQGHLPDKYKKPNHPTFSNESIYSNAVFPGGEWQKNGDKWLFKATPFNVQMHGADALKQYFQAVEPGNSIEFPQ